VKGACMNAAGISGWVPRPMFVPKFQPAVDWQKLKARHGPGCPAIESGMNALHHVFYLQVTVDLCSAAT